MTVLSASRSGTSTVGILHATLVGAVVSGTIFISCWLLAFASVPATHAFITLFTTSAVTSPIALAQALCWAIVFGGWVGFLIAAVHKLFAGIEANR